MTDNSDSLLLFSCPQCGEPMKAAAPGARCTCPTCGADFAAPATQSAAPPQPPTGADQSRSTPAAPPAEDDDEFQLSGPVERAKYDPMEMLAESPPDVVDHAPARKPPEEIWQDRMEALNATSRRTALLDSQPPPAELPLKPSMAAIVGFLFQAGALARWLGLSLALSIELYLVSQALELRNEETFSIGSLVQTIAAVVLGVLLLVTACVSWLAILRDTSNGQEQVDSWPDVMFVEWVLESFFLMNSFAISALLGLAAAFVLNAAGDLGWLIWLPVPLSVFVLWPFVLLSMLESNSMLLPVSQPMWQSLREATSAWILFYLASAVLAAIVCLLIGALYLGGVWAIVPVAFGLVAAVMIYFRMLGLLAWHCANVALEEEEKATQ